MKEGKGLLIVLEGPDDCGKSTLAKMAIDNLNSMGYSTTHLREPGGVELSEHLRRIILDPENTHKLDALTRAMLFGASRSHFVAQRLKPELDKGNVVVQERYILSTKAYQGYGDGINHEQLNTLCEMASRGVKPDITFILETRRSFDMRSLDTKEFMGKPDAFEAKGPEFQRRVWHGYLELQRKDPENIKLVPYLDLIKESLPSEETLMMYRKLRLEMMFNHIEPLLHKYGENINRQSGVGSVS